MKPLGLTPLFQLVIPTHAEDVLWEAIREAIDAGMSITEIRSEIAEAWRYYHEQDAKLADDLL